MKQVILVTILGLILLFMNSIGGCTTESPGPAQTVKPPPLSELSTVEPDQMALQVAEISPDFTIDYQAERVRSDASEWEIGHGWKKGYIIRFNRTDPKSLDSTFIIQSISVYSPDAIPAILQEGDLAYQKDDGFGRLPDPFIGDESRATRHTVRGNDSRGGTVIATSVQNSTAYSIDFVKKDVFERITMYGTMPDYGLLFNVSKKAADKVI